MNKPVNKPMNRQIVQEAAEWFVEFSTDTPDLETRRRFDTWLRASPEHMRAYLEMVPIWEDGARLPLEANTTPEQLIAWVQSGSNVVRMAAQSVDRSPARVTGRRYFRPLLAASILVALTGAALLWKYQQSSYPLYVTSIGEQRSLVLSDSSTVELNTLSKIRIHYTEHERKVELLQGQALFHVAKNTERPFVVQSGDTRVRAVGTLFDVYKRTEGTVITVVEGRVAVESRIPGMPGSVLLAAGDQIAVGAKAPGKVDRANLAGATAWTQRQLVFDSTPLSSVAEEFNRYNTRRLRIDAARLGDFRISGIFSSTDPASLVRFLREQPGVRVDESASEIRVRREE